MSEINVPNSPGKFISKWRSEGPVDDATIELWKDEMSIESWLMIAEAALFLDAAELFEQITVPPSTISMIVLWAPTVAMTINGGQMSQILGLGTIIEVCATVQSGDK